MDGVTQAINESQRVFVARNVKREDKPVVDRDVLSGRTIVTLHRWHRSTGRTYGSKVHVDLPMSGACGAEGRQRENRRLYLPCMASPAEMGAVSVSIFESINLVWRH